MKPIIPPESRCWLEIDLAALRQNYRITESMCSDGCMPIAVVKANAYGLGAVHIAQELERCGCRMLSTADLAEALELRRAGITAPILLLGPIDPLCVLEAMENDIIVPVVDAVHARLMDAQAENARGVLRTHIKLDVGLSRLGIPVPGREDEAEREVRSILSLRHLTNEALMTHISGMMEPEMDYRNVEQLEMFRRFGRRFDGLGLKMHCESSLLFLSHPEYRMDYVRLTSALLGIQAGYDALGVRSIAHFKTRLLQIKRVPKGTSVGYWMTYVAPRDMTVGIAGVGYGDGLIRSLCAGAWMSVREQRADVIGKLSMSFAALDLTDIPDAELGDEVTVFGAGPDVPSVGDYAALYGGHPCEVITMLKESIPRLYRE